MATVYGEEQALRREYQPDGICRVLSLDGAGAKGYYTLGVLEEIESVLDCPLYKRFDVVFGTSKGNYRGRYYLRIRNGLQKVLILPQGTGKVETRRGESEKTGTPSFRYSGLEVYEQGCLVILGLI